MRYLVTCAFEWDDEEEERFATYKEAAFDAKDKSETSDYAYRLIDYVDQSEELWHSGKRYTLADDQSTAGL